MHLGGFNVVAGAIWLVVKCLVDVAMGIKYGCRDVVTIGCEFEEFPSIG
jgi:hypothetical protein